MNTLVDSKLFINKNVFISKLKDGTRYILLKANNELIPLFIKNIAIDIINFIKDSSAGEEEIYRKFGDESQKYLSVLKSGNIVYGENEKESELDIQFDYDKQSAMLDYLAYETRTPLLAKIELTYNCNYKCKYCFVDGVSAKMMSLDDVKTIMKKLKENGVNELFLTGGEPFLHPNIMEMIDYSESLGFITTVQSNASLINEDIAKQLKKYNHVTLGISFHSSYEEKFDKFTQTKGAFKKTLAAVEILKNNNIPFFLKLPLTVDNQYDIKENIKFFEDNNYDFQVYSEIFPNVNDGFDTSKFGVEKKYIKWLYEKGYMKYSPSRCAALRSKMWISSNGDIYPCELTRVNMGNLIKEDFDSIWFSEKAEEVLKSNIYSEVPQCKKCDKKQYCNKCLAYLNYDNWSQGLMPFCETAEIIRSLDIER